jgi:hypothetical protein
VVVAPIAAYPHHVMCASIPSTHYATTPIQRQGPIVAMMEIPLQP